MLDSNQWVINSPLQMCVFVYARWTGLSIQKLLINRDFLCGWRELSKKEGGKHAEIGNYMDENLLMKSLKRQTSLK